MSDVFTISLTFDGTVKEVSGTVTGWQQWSELSIKEIEVSDDTTGVITVTVSDTTAGVWGAFDDISLVKAD